MMRKNNAELVSQVLGFRNLKDKCVEINELRKINDELESEVLGLMMIPGKWLLKEKLGGISDDNGELEIQFSELRKMKEKWVDVSDLNAELVEKKGELETQVCELRKLKGKLVDENIQLRSLLCVLEGERNTLVALVSKDDELEEKVKRNLITIDELRKQNRKLEDEKCKCEKIVESLNRKFEELQGRVVTEKDEGAVHDNEFGNGNVKVSLRRNGDICHSLGATAATAQPLSKGIKDERGSSLARGRKESKKVIEIIDLDDDEVDECTSRVLHVKKAGFGITVKTEYPSSSVEPQQEHSFSKQSLEIIRKISFSSRDTSASSDTSAISFYLEDLPISPVQLQAKRRKT